MLAGDFGDRAAMDHLDTVVQFYDTHPINLEQIRQALAADGIADDAVTEDHLQAFDQDHYGGVPALRTLVERAGIRREHRVLDVCSGMGGPARWIAHNVGARVTGLDLTASRVAGATELTRLARLDALVDFRQGSALAMPFDDASFDVLISEEAFAHVPDKPTLIAECARVVRPGGVVAFTDILARAPLPADVAARLRSGMAFAEIASADDYRQGFARLGYAPVSDEDLSDEWTRLLQQRLQMYRGMRDTTVAKFGIAHYQRYDDAYAFFVGLYAQRLLGGARLVFRRS